MTLNQKARWHNAYVITDKIGEYRGGGNNQARKINVENNGVITWLASAPRRGERRRKKASSNYRRDKKAMAQQQRESAALKKISNQNSVW